MLLNVLMQLKKPSQTAAQGTTAKDRSASRGTLYFYSLLWFRV